MRYAILGDIHSNLEALNAVIWALKKEDIDEYLCVGDIVGYNSNPKECIKIVREMPIKTIAGNHDWACIGRLPLEWFNEIAREAVLWTASVLNEEEKGFLKDLLLIQEYPNFVLVHGTLFSPEKFFYLDNLNFVYKSFQVLIKKICFLGHTHKPLIFSLDREGELRYYLEEKTFLNKDLHYIVNVGSVGQPRDGDPRACFCIYDEKKELLEFRRIEYDFRKTQEKILAQTLPEELALRLALGR